MRILILFLVGFFLTGCAGKYEFFLKEDEGRMKKIGEIRTSGPGIASYKDEKVEMKVDSKTEPLINLGVKSIVEE